MMQSSLNVVHPFQMNVDVTTKKLQCEQQIYRPQMSSSTTTQFPFSMTLHLCIRNAQIIYWKRFSNGQNVTSWLRHSVAQVRSTSSVLPYPSGAINFSISTGIGATVESVLLCDIQVYCCCECKDVCCILTHGLMQRMTRVTQNTIFHTWRGCM